MAFADMHVSEFWPMGLLFLVGFCHQSSKIGYIISCGEYAYN